MKTAKVMIFNKREGLFFHLVNKWNEIGSCACQSRGLFNAAVSGGKSPRPFFRQLSQNKIAGSMGSTGKRNTLFLFR